jgi:hypothetical protein
VNFSTSSARKNSQEVKNHSHMPDKFIQNQQQAKKLVKNQKVFNVDISNKQKSEKIPHMNSEHFDNGTRASKLNQELHSLLRKSEKVQEGTHHEDSNVYDIRVSSTPNTQTPTLKSSGSKAKKDESSKIKASAKGKQKNSPTLKVAHSSFETTPELYKDPNYDSFDDLTKLTLDKKNKKGNR